MRRPILLAVLALASCALPTRSESRICDKTICFDAISSYGNLYLLTKDVNPAKATPDLFPVAIASENVGLFPPVSLGDMDCNGSMSPPDSASSATRSGSMTCSSATATGNVTRLTIVATWRSDNQSGEWPLEQLEAEVTVVKIENPLS